jgi:hypothetical protein
MDKSFSVRSSGVAFFCDPAMIGFLAGFFGISKNDKKWFYLVSSTAW